MITAHLSDPRPGDRVLCGPSRATVTRVRHGDGSPSPGPHLDITYDSGRRDTVDRFNFNRPQLLLDEDGGALRALSMWLRAAADGLNVPLINVHDPIVARVLLGSATATDLARMASALEELGSAKGLG